MTSQYFESTNLYYIGSRFISEADVALQQFDESRAKAPEIYYPNNIGIAAPGSVSTYSFLVEGKSDTGSEQVFILEQFLRKGAKILSYRSWIYESVREFNLSVTCDLKDSKGTPDDFVINLRGLRFVNNAKVVSLKRRMFNELLFPLTMMDTSRVVALNPEGIFRIQDHLKTHAKKSDLVDAGRDVGEDIVRQIREKFVTSDISSDPNLDEAVKDNVIAFMSAAGWGKLHWEENKNKGQRILIQDPPTVSYGGTAAGNYLLQGIVEGLTEGCFHRRFTVVEDSYDNEIRLLSLSLLEQELASVGSEVQDDDQLSNQDKEIALREVQKIIQFIDNGASAPKANKAKEMEAVEIAVEQSKMKKEELSLVVPAISVGNQVQLVASNKNNNDLAIKTMEKDLPIVEHSQPQVPTMVDPSTGNVPQSAIGQSKHPVDRLKFILRAETSRFFPVLATKLFLPSSTNKEQPPTLETSDTQTKGSISDSSSREEVMHLAADTSDVKGTTKIEIKEAGNAKLEEKAATPESSERTSSGYEKISKEVEAVPEDKTTSSLEGAITTTLSPVPVTGAKRSSVLVSNESYDAENDIFSLGSEEEMYYEESFD